MEMDKSRLVVLQFLKIELFFLKRGKNDVNE